MGPTTSRSVATRGRWVTASGSARRWGRQPAAICRVFYGHTLPSPVPVTPEVFLRLTLYFSAYGVIVNRLGRRFTDESLGDEVSNQFVLHQPGKRAVLIWDDEVHQQRALAVPYPSGMALDRHAEATELGARTAQTDTLGELVQVVAGWGSIRRASGRPSRTTSGPPRARPWR